MDIEITGGVITKESLLGSFSKVSDKMSSSVTSDAVKEEKTSEETKEPVQSSSSASSTLQDRVERAKMLVEQRKAEKEAAEGDKEKSKEMERREVGKVSYNSEVIMVEVEELQEELVRVRVVILCEEDCSENLLDRLLVSICCCIPCLF